MWELIDHSLPPPALLTRYCILDTHLGVRVHSCVKNIYSRIEPAHIVYPPVRRTYVCFENARTFAFMPMPTETICTITGLRVKPFILRQPCLSARQKMCCQCHIVASLVNVTFICTKASASVVRTTVLKYDHLADLNLAILDP